MSFEFCTDGLLTIQGVGSNDLVQITHIDEAIADLHLLLDSEILLVIGERGRVVSISEKAAPRSSRFHVIDEEIALTNQEKIVQTMMLRDSLVRSKIITTRIPMNLISRVKALLIFHCRL